MRYLGVDYGTKKVGLALSDDAGTMGFPHGTVPNARELLETLAALIARENVGAVVVGESKDFSGRDNPVAEEARAFAKQLRERAGVPVLFEDERFTSAAARRAPAKEKKTRAAKTRAPVDASAAALILTSYLNKIQQQGASHAG